MNPTPQRRQESDNCGTAFQPTTIQPNAGASDYRRRRADWLVERFSRQFARFMLFFKY
jgi:hypothetical protein